MPFALLIALINPFVVREGLTVFARLGEVPPFGQVDLTLEALVYGALLGLRVVAVVLACAPADRHRRPRRAAAPVPARLASARR